MTFESLGIIDPILRALRDQGYTQPTPIQEQSIPTLLQGRDLLGAAQTGTGKTCAFAVPILQHLQERTSPNGKAVRALVVAPTRELALQISESFTAYGKYTQLKNTVVFGGVNQNKQTRALQKGVDILVATPGRLLDLIGQGYISLDRIEYFVLDEADHMLDMGFIHDIKKIIKLLPKKRQSLFFSATMSKDAVQLSRQILGNPEKVEIKPQQTTAEQVDQAVYFVGKKSKRKLLLHLLKTEDMDSTLVFSRTKHGADRIVRQLNKAKIAAAAIHGNKSQNARQRALGKFKDGEINVLVATDIAARGIDVDELSHVVNFDLPNVPETYVHRIGRTGRAKASGVAMSFCDIVEKDYLKDIQKLIDERIPVVEDHPFVASLEDEAEASTKPKQNGGSRNNGGRNKKRNNNKRRNNRRNKR
jgi:ATP-dependent RNA helicase RhlE